MVKLKLFGLGGQGVVTAANAFSIAYSLYDNKYAVTIPAYGHERRGAPVNSSIIADETPVRLNSFVYHPDVVVVFDSEWALEHDQIAEGIGPNSILVANAANEKIANTLKSNGFQRVYYTDATKIAVEEIGKPIPNGAMLGIMAAAGLVSIEAVEHSLMDTLGKGKGEANVKAARRAYDECAQA